MINFEPMLAQKTNRKRIDFDSKDYVIQPKLDGIRCYITFEGMFTRNHKPIVSAPHVWEEAQAIFKEYGNDVILDGELYNHDLKNDFEKIVSLVRKTKPSDEDIQESKQKVQYHCYDVFFPMQKSLTFSSRESWRVRSISRKFDYILHVGSAPVKSHDKIAEIEQIYLDDGYEGAMVREDAAYEQKRSWTLQKVKRFQDEEAIIFSFVEGVGKLEGKMGKFMMIDANGIEFGCPPTSHSFEEREEMWKNRHDYIGKEATFEFFERTKRGVPRFPIFKTVRNYE